MRLKSLLLSLTVVTASLGSTLAGQVPNGTVEAHGNVQMQQEFGIDANGSVRLRLSPSSDQSETQQPNQVGADEDLLPQIVAGYRTVRERAARASAGLDTRIAGVLDRAKTLHRAQPGDTPDTPVATLPSETAAANGRSSPALEGNEYGSLRSEVAQLVDELQVLRGRVDQLLDRLRQATLP